MQLLENFKHADTFAQMTLGERLGATMYVILLGMGITFIALILIWAMTALLSKVVQNIEKKSQPSVMPAPTKGTSAPVATVAQAVEADPGELIAVISAAIAASMQTSMHNIVVTRISRTGDDTPVWGQRGRSDIMQSRL
ncbi:MAG: glutaconyl-CoA/methylmalonyl-CoA decarboxylase subunit delta [Clostridiales bacterium]|jgi:sodium pump decarboxylase gamma subunit|nr:glutaconyl-CoA/methylmalonyl-CoA decarboxylase subunit delta [Clostridiales bacterium]MDN5297887.1 glutaconyl-CoA/methylmalonyl-CoA decarboxylase subunit delta [Clostridiales bacterium]